MKEGPPQWFPGRIEKHCRGDTYLVLFEDGATAKLTFQLTKKNMTWTLDPAATRGAAVGAAATAPKKRKKLGAEEEEA